MTTYAGKVGVRWAALGIYHIARYGETRTLCGRYAPRTPPGPPGPSDHICQRCQDIAWRRAI